MIIRGQGRFLVLQCRWMRPPNLPPFGIHPLRNELQHLFQILWRHPPVNPRHTVRWPSRRRSRARLGHDLRRLVALGGATPKEHVRPSRVAREPVRLGGVNKCAQLIAA